MNTNNNNYLDYTDFNPKLECVQSVQEKELMKHAEMSGYYQTHGTEYLSKNSEFTNPLGGPIYKENTCSTCFAGASPYGKDAFRNSSALNSNHFNFKFGTYQKFDTL